MIVISVMKKLKNDAKHRYLIKANQKRIHNPVK